jgi:hypothetical protein
LLQHGAARLNRGEIGYSFSRLPTAAAAASRVGAAPAGFVFAMPVVFRRQRRKNIRERE